MFSSGYLQNDGNKNTFLEHFIKDDFINHVLIFYQL